MAEPTVIYVITWRYSDGSGSGATAAFTDKARAERLVEILDRTDSMQLFKVEAVPFDLGTSGVGVAQPQPVAIIRADLYGGASVHWITKPNELPPGTKLYADGVDLPDGGQK